MAWSVSEAGARTRCRALLSSVDHNPNPNPNPDPNPTPDLNLNSNPNPKPNSNPHLNQVQKLCYSFEERGALHGERLQQQGQPSRFLYLVSEGEVHVRISGREAGRAGGINLARCGRGSLLGELDTSQDKCGVALHVASQRATLLRVDRADFVSRIGAEGVELLVALQAALTLTTAPTLTPTPTQPQPQPNPSPNPDHAQRPAGGGCRAPCRRYRRPGRGPALL